MWQNIKGSKLIGRSEELSLFFNEIGQTVNFVFRCDQCGEAFARLDNLLRHSARHKHGKIFGCEICHKGFHRKVCSKPKKKNLFGAKKTIDVKQTFL